MFAQFVKRLPWLDTQHPIARRDLRWLNQLEQPGFIRKLSDPWALLGYAAMIHGAVFALSLVTYRLSQLGLNGLFLPFMTPFGTPFAAALLHSVLYWTMMIGITNQTTISIGREVQSGTWDILKLTPYASSEMIGAKIAAVFRNWGRVFRSLLIFRVVALLIIPAFVLLQRQNSETHQLVSYQFIHAAVFLLQPYVDALLVTSLSTVAAVRMSGSAWTRLGAYGLVGLIYGGISGIASFWMIFFSPMGLMGSLLAPFGHWGVLIAALVKPQAPEELLIRTIMIVIVYLLLPLISAVLAFWYAWHTLRREQEPM